jgi:hypothetical protein
MQCWQVAATASICFAAGAAACYFIQVIADGMYCQKHLLATMTRRVAILHMTQIVVCFTTQCFWNSPQAWSTGGTSNSKRSWTCSRRGWHTDGKHQEQQHHLARVGVLASIGNTPLIRITSLSEATGCEVLY